MKRQGYKGLRILKIMCMIAVGLVLGTGLFQMSAKAASGYVIKINKQANCVTIYKENEKGQLKPVKALICSTGYATKLGTYSLGEKLRWHVLDGPCYGQYCTRIYGGVLFHSVWYTGQNNPATLSISSYNKLGTTASHGCVRLTVAGAIMSHLVRRLSYIQIRIRDLLENQEQLSFHIHMLGIPQIPGIQATLGTAKSLLLQAQKIRQWIIMPNSIL